MIKEVTGAEAMGYLSTRPTMIVTTLHASGVVNAGVFGAYTNLSSTEIGIAVATGHHTYANMKRTGEFVVNVPGADIVKAIRTLAAAIPPERSEVDEAGLTTRKGLAVRTPSIAERVAAVEFSFAREVEIGEHSLMIGQVLAGWAKQQFLDADGRIDIFKARVFRDFKYPQPLYVLPGQVVEG